MLTVEETEDGTLKWSRENQLGSAKAEHDPSPRIASSATSALKFPVDSALSPRPLDPAAAAMICCIINKRSPFPLGFTLTGEVC